MTKKINVNPTDWVDVKPKDEKTILFNCVECCATTAQMHQNHFGVTTDDHHATAHKFATQMSNGPNHAIKYLPTYKDSANNSLGQVAVLFQRMAWMSQYAVQEWGGPVWTLTIGFDGNVLTANGNDPDYAYFLDTINAPGGPIDTFMSNNKLTSLFAVGPVGTQDTRKRQIGQLEIVATQSWKPQRGTWTFKAAMTIDAKFTGHNALGIATKISPTVLTYWGPQGPPPDPRFQLTQANFKP